MTTEYISLCRNIGNIPCSVLQIEALKSRYKNCIQSKRRLCQIKTVRDLIIILQKRDVINEIETGVLVDIARDLGRDGEALNMTINHHHRQSDLSPRPNDLQERVYRRISEDIGYKWKDFARALRIREGYIDNLEEKYRNVSDRVLEILLYFHNNCDQRQWRTLLLNALIEARRSDLQLEVSFILDTFS